MRFVTLSTGGQRRCGVVVDGMILDLTAASGERLITPLRKILRDPALVEQARQLAERATQDSRFADRFCFPMVEGYLLAPIPWPGKVICLGLNYRDHAAESGMEIPDEPVVFFKASSSVIRHAQAICLPDVSDKVDYEVELAVVIGPRAKDVSAADAMEHVAGYTILNDVTARDYQREKPGGQWALAKSFDTFCPLGPWIVTPDEIPDPHDLHLECVVSGETMQSSSTAQMIFTVPQVIEYLSAVMTLEPGDVIGMGTPAGVGYGREPQRFLRPGDTVECTIEKIGTLSNPVH